RRGGERDPRRPVRVPSPPPHDRGGTVQRPGRHRLGGGGEPRGPAPGTKKAMKALTFLARRFVAGETPQAAIEVGQRLNEKKIKATFDLLGEDVLDRQAAERAAEAQKELLRLIPEGIERNISIKLSSLGQEISREFCLENAEGILKVAKQVGGFVRFDMEGTKTTQST